MLEITVPKTELWDPKKEEFVNLDKDVVIQLEHSLISISKWESKWEKPFFDKLDKTPEETIDYIRCMTIGKIPPPEVYIVIQSKKDIFNQIMAYITKPMTATFFAEDKNRKGINNKIITNELIYYWMINFNIPSEYEKWHINRLLTLIRVCGEENKPHKKRPSHEIAKEYSELNAKRHAEMALKRKG